MERLEVKETNK